MTAKTNLSYIHTLFLLLVTTSVLIMTSCGSSRHAIGGKGENGNQSIAAAYTALVESYDNSWSTMSVPVTIALKSPKNIKASGTLTMTRGKDIGVSVRVLGIEVASIYIDNDSIWALDKWHKYYIAESISDLLKGFPASVENVQDIILGHAFILGDKPLTASDLKKFHIEDGDQNWYMSPRKSPGKVSYRFTIADGGNLTTLDATAGTHPVTCTYGDYTLSTPAGPVTSSATITATGGKKSIVAVLEMRSGKAKWNGNAARPITIPGGYTRIKASDLLKAIPDM